MNINKIFPVIVFVAAIGWLLGTASMFSAATDMSQSCSDMLVEKAFAMRFLQFIVAESLGMLLILFGAVVAWKAIFLEQGGKRTWLPVLNSTLLIVVGAVLILFSCWRGISVSACDEPENLPARSCEPC